MIDFAAAVTDYLAIRRAMGYKLVEDERLLGQLAAYLDAIDAEHLRVADALAWATQPTGAAPAWHAVRLGTVRSFARYLTALDPATEIPPVGLLPEPDHRVIPYIYSDDDISQIIAEAGRLAPEHRADTYQTLIALIFVSGMRVGEAVRLDNDDVDFDDGIITIRDTKFGKSRQVPLHATTVDALRSYAGRRDERRPKPKSASLFTSSIGTRLLRDNVSTVFPRLVRSAGVTAPPGRRSPRLHDARHTFAVRCLIGWYRTGADVRQRLPLLSTYLGHVDPTTTYWYLSAVPELVELIAARLDTDAEEQP
ncbi:MAG: tyrosine-type recombinase/integrase [Chloroflexi bacterium]|nr:tyrosine-type recombinase/integrase [Chloroflexota bacterium]